MGDPWPRRRLHPAHERIQTMPAHTAPTLAHRVPWHRAHEPAPARPDHRLPSPRTAGAPHWLPADAHPAGRPGAPPTRTPRPPWKPEPFDLRTRPPHENMNSPSVGRLRTRCPLGEDRGYLWMSIPPEEGVGGAQHVDSPKSPCKNVAVSLIPGPGKWSHEGMRLVAWADRSDAGPDVLAPEVDGAFGSVDALPVFARGTAAQRSIVWHAATRGPLAVCRLGRINA
jgi:hypothetical protein